MNALGDYKQPDEKYDDPANQDDFPATDYRGVEDDRDIDIDNDDSEEIPDGDDVDLERAE